MVTLIGLVAAGANVAELGHALRLELATPRMLYEQPEIIVPEDVRVKAYESVARMLEMSK